MISGTHTHSAPGGFLMYFLLDFSIAGFSTATFEALVQGIAQVSLSRGCVTLTVKCYIFEVAKKP